MDVNPRNRGKAWASAVVAVIPGPSAPSTIRPYLQRTIEGLQRLATSGIRVTQTFTDGAGVLRKLDFDHHAFLWGVLADTPARIDTGFFAGVGSYFGACTWCCWEGVGVPNPGGRGTTVRYKGFHVGQPVRCVPLRHALPEGLALARWLDCTIPVAVRGHLPQPCRTQPWT